jgi:glycogen operon protein
VRRLILDSLRYWVREMHVDGFRFDLASILSRDEEGRPMQAPPVLWDIESDPVLAGTKLIAEAWDPAGLYQVGSFVGDSWKEWNGRFRDDVRGFAKSDPGLVRALAYRLMGSPDIYLHEEREAEQSVNFITCHDGFTLNDLVSYNGKHNEANGEGNRDGTDNNLSWNSGAEGPADDPEVERLRHRRVRNFLTLTLISVGTPMLLMGDEARRTQLGNNNAYCQNNEISWLDWGLVERHAGLVRFVQGLVHFRLSRGSAASAEDVTLIDLLRQEQVQWHGVRLGAPDWSDSSRSLAFTATMPGRGLEMHVMVNAYWEPLTFELPPVGGARQPWRRCIDTFLDAPEDLHDPDDAPAIPDSKYTVQPRSVVVLTAWRKSGSGG